MPSSRIIIGDARTALADLPAASVQCCVTSPPYFGLRDYQTPGQIGLEATVDAYVAELVAVFREVRRALRDDGVAFLNIGDCYAATTKGSSGASSRSLYDDGRPAESAESAAATKGKRAALSNRRATIPAGLKPKDLLMVPARVALALQADGWWLRSEIVWRKPNPMPESCKDRPTSAHEKVFLLAKSASYFWDAEAVREPARTSPDEYASKVGARGRGQGKGQAEGVYHGFKDSLPFSGGLNPAGRNARNVQTWTPKPFKGFYDFAGADYVDDRGIPRKLSPDCPVHGLSEPLRPGTPGAGACGGPPAAPVYRRTGTGADLDLAPLPVGAPTECYTARPPSDNPPTQTARNTHESKTRASAPDVAEGGTPQSIAGIQQPDDQPILGDTPRVGSQTASASSTESHRTAHAPCSSEHGTPYEECSSSTPRTGPELFGMTLHSHTDASKNGALPPSLHATGTALSEPPARTSRIGCDTASTDAKCFCRESKLDHFAAMPLEMAEWCVKAGSRPGDAVLDPFAGAGTTLLAANRLGRDAVGVELNAAYAALAEARIAAGTAPEPKPSRSSRRARVPPPAPSLFDALLAAE